MKKHIQAIVIAGFIVAASAAHADANYDLFHSIEVDNSRGVASLLKEGMDPNTRDAKGQVAIYVALRGNSLAAAEQLLAAPRLDPNATNAAGETPLMMAALRGQVAMMETLIAKGAQINKDGWQPIHYAATGEEPKAVALLLARGAPIDARSPSGLTPLMMAARYGSEPVVDLLIARGANKALRNDIGESAADRARAGGREFLVERLTPAAGAR